MSKSCTIKYISFLSKNSLFVSITDTVANILKAPKQIMSDPKYNTQLDKYCV